MKEYIVKWVEEVKYHLIVIAESEEKAKDKFFDSEYNPADIEVGDGNLVDDSVEASEV